MRRPSPSGASPWRLIWSKAIDAATHQNDVPVLRRVEIVNESSETLRDLTLHLSFEPAFARDERWSFAEISAGQTIAPREHDVALDPGFDEASQIATWDAVGATRGRAKLLSSVIRSSSAHQLLRPRRARSWRRRMRPRPIWRASSTRRSARTFPRACWGSLSLALRIPHRFLERALLWRPARHLPLACRLRPGGALRPCAGRRLCARHGAHEPQGGGGRRGRGARPHDRLAEAGAGDTPEPSASSPSTASSRISCSTCSTPRGGASPRSNGSSPRTAPSRPW